MHDHLDQGDGRNADIFEVIWVGAPWFRVVDLLDLCGVQGVESIAVGIDELDSIFDLYNLVSRYLTVGLFGDIPQAFCASILTTRHRCGCFEKL